jgi:hypothetical protein
VARRKAHRLRPAGRPAQHHRRSVMASGASCPRRSHWSSPPCPPGVALGYVAPEGFSPTFSSAGRRFQRSASYSREAIAERLFHPTGMDAIVAQLVGEGESPSPPQARRGRTRLPTLRFEALAVDPADRWPHVGVLGPEIETIAGCLASSKRSRSWCDVARRRSAADRDGRPRPHGAGVGCALRDFARAGCSAQVDAEPMASPPRTARSHRPVSSSGAVAQRSSESGVNEMPSDAPRWRPPRAAPAKPLGRRRQSNRLDRGGPGDGLFFLRVRALRP